MRPLRTSRALCSVLLLVAAAAPAGGQEPTDRPRIGLVLSGGGARGIAHIGVLEVLEEMRVPVDIVTGTSMGALVGGLYAAGVPVDSIRGIVSRADWDALLADRPVRATLEFPPRARQRRYTIEIEAGLSREEVILPGGLIAGQELGLLLRRATAPVAAVEDFRELPIPFAAVATDIAAFERVVLNDGDLVEAMRASMAIPIAIAPVEVDGRLLVDGGLVDDLPVQLAREMGAEVVIAVDVTPPLLERDELSGLLDIAQQIVRGLGRIGVDAQRESADVAIVPELNGVSVFDFRRSDEIRERGVRATRAAADSLRRWTLTPEAYARRIADRSERMPAFPNAITDVRLSGPGVDDRLVRARLDRDPSRAFDPSRAERLARRVYATGLFERVGWDIDPRGADLVIDARLHPHGPHLLLGGLDLVLDSAGESPPRASVEVVLGYLRTRIGARAAEWRVDLRLGTKSGIETAFRQPLDFGTRWFVEPSAAALRIERPVYEAGRSEEEYETDLVALGLDAGRTLGSWAEARVGLRAERSTSELEPSTEHVDGRFPEESETTIDVHGALVIDRLDAVGIPRRGEYVHVAARASREELGSERDWASLSIEARIYGSLGSHTLFGRVAGGGSTPAGDLPAREELLLGGFGSLTGYADGELRGEAYAVARAGWLLRIAELPPAFRAILAGAWADAGDTWDPSIDEDPRARTTVTAGLGVETLLGPVFLAWTPLGGEGRVTLSVGRSP